MGILPGDNDMLHGERTYALGNDECGTTHPQNRRAGVERIEFACPPFRLTDHNEIGAPRLARDRLGGKFQS